MLGLTRRRQRGLEAQLVRGLVDTSFDMLVVAQVHHPRFGNARPRFRTKEVFSSLNRPLARLP